MIIDGRGAATPEDEKVFVDLECRCSGDCMFEQIKGHGLIDGSTPNEDVERMGRNQSKGIATTVP
jgi:hypothetical protein